MVSKAELKEMRRNASRGGRFSRALHLFEKREEKKHKKKARRNKAG